MTDERLSRLRIRLAEIERHLDSGGLQSGHLSVGDATQHDARLRGLLDDLPLTLAEIESLRRVRDAARAVWNYCKHFPIGRNAELRRLNEELRRHEEETR